MINVADSFTTAVLHKFTARHLHNGNSDETINVNNDKLFYQAQVDVTGVQFGVNLFV